MHADGRFGDMEMARQGMDAHRPPEQHPHDFQSRVVGQRLQCLYCVCVFPIPFPKEFSSSLKYKKIFRLATWLIKFDDLHIELAILHRSKEHADACYSLPSFS